MTRLYSCLSTLFLLLFSLQQGYSQYYRGSRLSGEYMVAAVYGVGNSHWLSDTRNHVMFDTRGNQVVGGDYGIRTNSFSQMLGVEAVFPFYQGFSAGLGIAFEEHQLSGLDIVKPVNSFYFNHYERFRFDKVYAHAEMPVNLIRKKNFMTAVQWRGGYYSFAYLKSDNLFGESRVGRSLFSGFGFVAQYEFTQGFVAFVNPYFEYKYFKNKAAESPVEIRHNVLSYHFNLGIRYICF
jgi:hypothetical protein